MMAGPLISLPVPLPSAKCALVVSVDSNIQRIGHPLPTSNTTPYVVLERMWSTLLSLERNTPIVAVGSWGFSLAKASNWLSIRTVSTQTLKSGMFLYYVYIHMPMQTTNNLM
jgi:hypothetical protein